MNTQSQFQPLHPNAGHAWRNLKQEPPRSGQREYSLVLRRSIASKGINSPPSMEVWPDVPQQFTRFAFRA